MWLPCDCAQKLQGQNDAYGVEEGWGGQGSCSCYGGPPGSSGVEGLGGSVLVGSEDCSCLDDRRGSKGFGGGGTSGFVGRDGSGFRSRRGSKGVKRLKGSKGGSSGGFGNKGGIKGHGSSRTGGRKGSSDVEGSDGAQAREGEAGGKGGGSRGKQGDGAKGGEGTKGGDGAIGGDGSNESDSSIVFGDEADEGGDGGSGVGGKRSGGGRAVGTVGKTGLMKSLWSKLYGYCGPVGLWNLVLAMLVLGYYGKSYYWDSLKGRGYPSGGRRGATQVGGKIKCAPKQRTPCDCNCACLDKPRILKHRLKWPEEDNKRCG